MAGTFTVTYEGTTDLEHNISERVEIDDFTGDKALVQGQPRSGFSKDQVDRLEGLKHHKFTVERDDQQSDGLDRLKTEQLEALAAEHEVDISDASTNPERVALLRDAGVAAEGQ